MLKTETIIIANGKTTNLLTTGKWFRLRNLVAAAAPIGTILSLTCKVISAGPTHRGRLLADGVTLYEGDRLTWDDAGFEQIDLKNTTGYDITAEVRSSDQGDDDLSHVKIDNFPDVGGTALQSTADKLLAAGSGAAQLILAANVNRRSVTIGGRADMNPATKLRIGDALITATRGAELMVGGEHTFDVKGAIYGWNTDGVNDANVTILELLN